MVTANIMEDNTVIEEIIENSNTELSSLSVIGMGETRPEIILIHYSIPMSETYPPVPDQLTLL